MEETQDFLMTTSSSCVNVDAALKTLGGLRSRYQQIMLFLLALMEIPCAWLYLADAFTTDIPGHLCSTGVVDRNAKNNTVTHEGSEWTASQCSLSMNITVTNNGFASNHSCLKIKDCDQGWDYTYTNDAKLGGSIISEWDLVCDHSSLVGLITTVFFAGDMLGALIMPALSDTFGRRRVFLVSTLGVIPLTLGTAFINHYVAFIVLRFFAAFCLNGSWLSLWTLVIEYLTTNQRAVGTQIIDIFWALGLMSLSGVAYLLPGWRWLFIVASATYVIFIIPVFWFVPESVHYYIANGKTSEAEAVLVKIAKFNKIQLPRLHLEGAIPMTAVDDFSTSHHGSHHYNKKKIAILSILTTPYLRLQALLSCAIWIINALVYYGLSLNSTKMAGNKYLNFFISSSVEIPAYILCAISLHYFRRRIPIALFHVLAGISLLLMLTIPYMGESQLAGQTVLATAGKLGITASYASVYVYMPELFPTVVRNSGLGLLSISSRIGAMLAPHFVYFDAEFMSPIVFGSLAMVASGIILFLPETYKRPLPETLDDVAQSWQREKQEGKKCAEVEVNNK